MNINATLLGEALMFAIFIWFCMKFIWPPIMSALEKRRKIVESGLESARMGEVALRDASLVASQELETARKKAAEILLAAERSAHDLVEAGKVRAKVEAESILASGRTDVEFERNRMSEDLRERFAELVVSGAEKIIHSEISATVHRDLIQSIANEL